MIILFNILAQPSVNSELTGFMIGSALFSQGWLFHKSHTNLLDERFESHVAFVLYGFPPGLRSQLISVDSPPGEHSKTVEVKSRLRN